MSNMAYCRFQNTLEDLRDCNEHILVDLSSEEDRARECLISECMDIVAQTKEA